MNTNTIGLGLLRQPCTVLFGPGQRRELGVMAAGIGSKGLLVTDARMAGTAEFAHMRADVEAQGVTTLVYAGVEPDLPYSNIEAALDLARGKGLELVIGIGGGSCLDAAKVTAAMLGNDGSIRDYYGEFRLPRPGLPVITVPTTGGTGAEITCISVVYDVAAGMKLGVASPHLEPRAAIIDPELTLTCPPGLTATTAADALSHLVESFTARCKNPSADELRRHLYVGKNRLTDIWLREGLALITRSMARVIEAPHDLQARSDMMLAATCAGMGINTTGTAGAHAIQAPIGALTHTAHGFGVSALLPYVMRYNLPDCQADFAAMAGPLGVGKAGMDESSLARAAISRVDDLLIAVGAPVDLRTLGLAPDQFDFVATQALKATRLTANNPRPLTHDAILQILARGHAGDRSWWSI